VTADHEAARLLLGGYVLGGLDAAEQYRVDAHLSACPECRVEVERLAAVPELLQRLPADPAADPPAQPSRAGLDAFLRRARPHRLPLAMLTGAAAVLVLVLVAVLLLRPGRQPAPPVAAGSPSATAAGGTVVQFVAAPGSGLSGKATLTPRQWGVSVALELAGLPGEGPFALHVLGRGGNDEQAACWGHTSSAQARVTGASSIQLANVDAVTVTDYEGRLLGSAKPS
jgi:hypothetical protein